MTATATEPTTETEKSLLAATLASGRNIFQRLVALRLALADAGGIGKGGTAPAVMGGFKFVAWEDVASKLGALFAAHGVVPIVSMTECNVEQAGTTSGGKPIHRATVCLSISMVNADAPDDRLEFTFFGTGDDGGDKAVNKAVTSATKYGLMKLFMLGGAEDSDGSTNEIATTGSSRPPLPPKQPAASSGARAPQAAAEGEILPGEKTLCTFCAAEGLTTKTGKEPRYYKAPNGRLTCNGMSDPGDPSTYVNHGLPPADGVTDVNPDDIPF